MKMRGTLLATVLALISGPSFAAQWYIGPPGVGSDSNPGTQASPWASYNHARGVMAAGDSVRYLAGTYAATEQAVITIGGISNAQPTVIDCAGDGTCKLHYTGSYQAIQVGAPYVHVGSPGHGFDVSNTDPTAYAVGGYSATVHDVFVQGNYVHDSGGGCIGFTRSDRTFILDNIIWNCAFTAPNQTSGISPGFDVAKTPNSIADLANLPYGGAYGTLVARNIIYNVRACNSTNSPSCPANTTDGNGIAEDTKNASGYNGGPALIENNIVFGNGGRGITCIKSSNVTVRNNTSYGNSQDTLDGVGSEINATGCQNFQSYNNIAEATQTNVVSGAIPGAYRVQDATTTPAIHDWNIAVVTNGGLAALSSCNTPPCNGTMFGTHTVVAASSQFTAPLVGQTGPLTRAAVIAAFTPKPGSAALKAGYPFFASATDAVGNSRSSLWSVFGQSRVDAGAVQVTN